MGIRSRSTSRSRSRQRELGDQFHALIPPLPTVSADEFVGRVAADRDRPIWLLIDPLSTDDPSSGFHDLRQAAATCSSGATVAAARCHAARSGKPS